ncbi:MAG TPA: hypothetical protein VHT26_17730 [Trebonia sp.]|nr:hypothetical protein [Trebonia sp.]
MGVPVAAGPGEAQGETDLPGGEVGTGTGAQVAAGVDMRVGTGEVVPAPFGSGLATAIGDWATVGSAVAEGVVVPGEGESAADGAVAAVSSVADVLAVRDAPDEA